MICNGKARSFGDQLVSYLTKSDKNDTATVLSLSREDTISAEIAHMEADARGSRCRKPLYHAQVRSRDGEHLTRQQMQRAVVIYEEEMGFQGLARAVVVHRFKDHDHLHIVWGRIDPERGRARDYKHDFAKQERAARRMEAEFGIARTRGRFYDENGERITAGSDRKQSQTRKSQVEHGQEQRSEIDTNDRKTEISALWAVSRNGREFRQRIEERGYTLVRGSRKDVYMLVDAAGEAHGLRQQLKCDGVTALDVTSKMADVPLTSLPTVTEIRRQMRQAQADRMREQTVTRREDRGREGADARPAKSTRPLQRRTPHTPDNTGSRSGGNKPQTVRETTRSSGDTRLIVPGFRALEDSRQAGSDQTQLRKALQEYRGANPRPVREAESKTERRSNIDLHVERSVSQVERGMFSKQEIEAQQAAVKDSSPGSEEHAKRLARLLEMVRHQGEQNTP